MAIGAVGGRRRSYPPDRRRLRAPGAAAPGLQSPAMVTFLATFTVFVTALALMAVGVMVAGKRLSGSCGGRGPNGEPLGDCLCEKAREEALARGEPAPELPPCPSGRR